MRITFIIAAAVVMFAAIARFGSTVTAQTPTPVPAPQTVTIPGRATLEPDQRVTFRRADDGATLTVSYHGTDPATVTYDGAVLTVSVPPLLTSRFLSVRGVAGCLPGGGRSDVRCDVRPSAGGGQVFVSVLNAHPPVPLAAVPPGLMLVPLAAGCTNVALTFPDGTSVDRVHDAVHAPAFPVTRVEAVWRYDNVGQRFLGWSAITGAPNDFERVNRLDTVFICKNGPGQLVQPAIP